MVNFWWPSAQKSSFVGPTPVNKSVFDAYREWGYQARINFSLEKNHGVNSSYRGFLSTMVMAGQPTPPNVPPPEMAGLMIRAYENPLVSLNKADY